MNNAELKNCNNKRCNNLALDGKYCMHFKQVRKEKRGNFLKAAGSITAFFAPIVLAGITKKKPK